MCTFSGFASLWVSFWANLKKKEEKNPTLHLSWAAYDLQLSFAFHAHLLTSGSRHTHCISLLQSLFYFHSQLFPTFSTLLKPSANSLFHLCAQATTFLLASCWSSRKCMSLDPGNIYSHVHSVPASEGMSSSKANSYTLMLIPVSLTHMPGIIPINLFFLLLQHSFFLLS